jgi:hypothetical protein
MLKLRSLLMSFTCKTVPKLAACVVIAASSFLAPFISQANMLPGFDESQAVAFASDSADSSNAATLLAFSTEAAFGAATSSGLAGNVVEKTNVPAPVPVPASWLLFVVGAAAFRAASKRK